MATSNTNGADTPTNTAAESSVNVGMSTRINLEQCRKLAKDLLAAFTARKPAALRLVRARHPRFRQLAEADFLAQPFKLADAQLVIARVHHFENWTKLSQHVRWIERADPAVKRFEDAADAIINGNLELLAAMLREHPGLIRERSTRAHDSTLLHYVSANGVEDYRQITPPNIVDITRLLLDAGADVNATSKAYRGDSTTLGLTATSAHPRLGGVQLSLIDLLVERGATIPLIIGSGGPVHDCIANGCAEAAAHLVRLGATSDNLYGAAALGLNDAMRQLLPASNMKQRESAMIIAAECDHADVVTYLLENDVSVTTYDDGMTALHWASANGNVALMDLLISLGAQLEARNEFGGTVLSSTLWFAHHALPEDFATRNYPAVIDWLIAAGARTDCHPDMPADIDGVHQRTNL